MAAYREDDQKDRFWRRAIGYNSSTTKSVTQCGHLRSPFGVSRESVTDHLATLSYVSSLELRERKNKDVSDKRLDKDRQRM